MVIEQVLYDYLNSVLEVDAYFEVKDIDEYVLIEKFESRRVNGLMTAGFTFECYSDSLINSILLEQTLQEAMDDFSTTTNIFEVSLNNSQNLTDTTLKRYCQCSTYFITYI